MTSLYYIVYSVYILCQNFQEFSIYILYIFLYIYILEICTLFRIHFWLLLLVHITIMHLLFQFYGFLWMKRRRSMHSFLIWFLDVWYGREYQMVYMEYYMRFSHRRKRFIWLPYSYNISIFKVLCVPISVIWAEFVCHHNIAIYCLFNFSSLIYFYLAIVCWCVPPYFYFVFVVYYFCDRNMGALCALSGV